jgi:lipoyl synthase
MKEDKRLPRWFLQPVRSGGNMREVEELLKRYELHTVCESARCPNRMECFSRGTATFMIMGDRCTRNCAFCGVEKGEPLPLEPGEPARLAEVARRLGLDHVVVTSVTRDDLSDGGAEHFSATIKAVRGALPEAGIEVLVPDFQGSDASLATVVEAGPNVFNHNLETVRRLYRRVRPDADYRRSLRMLRVAKELHPGLVTKSGLMVGLGERAGELEEAFLDLAQSGCDILTLGQYLRPHAGCAEVERFPEPREFEELEDIARGCGLREVVSAPLVRSSYRARESMQRITC